MHSALIKVLLCVAFVVHHKDIRRGWHSVFADEARLVYSVTTVMTYLPPLSPSLKHKRPNGQRSFHFIADDTDFIVDLQRYYPIGDVSVEYHQAHNVRNSSFIKDSDPLYQGIVRTDKIASFAFGRFMHTGHFSGYIRLKDTYFIEPAGFSYNKKLLIKFYKFSDALYPGCTSSYFFVYCKNGFDHLHATESAALKDLRIFPKTSAKEEEAVNPYLLFLDEKNGWTNGNNSDYGNGTSTTPIATELYNTSENYTQTLVDDIISFQNQSSNISAELRNYTEGIPGIPSNLRNRPHETNLTNVSNTTTIGNHTIFKKRHRTKKPTHNARRNFRLGAIEELKSLSCEVDVMADYSFLKKHELRTSCMLAEIYATIDFIDQYLRKVDFDGDRIENDIGLTLRKITVFTNETQSIFYTSKTFSVDWDTYLEEITKWKVRRGSHSPCLTIVMAHKEVVGGALGYSGSNKICQSHHSKNVVFLTTSPGRRIPPMAISFLAGLIHVAHTFGVHIGPIKTTKTSDIMDCTKKSRFINSNYDFYVDLLFNDCTMQGVDSVLKKADCLIKREISTCGDGIKNKGEACDCGPASECNAVDHCCTTDCRIKDGLKCSQESPCCNRTCFPVPATAKMICGDEGGVCNSNTCDGKNVECPEPPASFDGKHCLTEIDTIDALTCVEGSCVVPMCSEILYVKPCRCLPGSGYECHNCCVKHNGECLSVKDGFRATHQGLPYVRPENSSCFKKGKQCTSIGTCESISEAVNNEPNFVHVLLFVSIFYFTMFTTEYVR